VTYRLPHELGRCGLLTELTPGQFADAIAESLHAGTPDGSRADRAVDVWILQQLMGVLGVGGATPQRLAAAVRAALGHIAPNGLLSPSEQQLIAGDLFPAACRQQVTANLVCLDAVSAAGEVLTAIVSSCRLHRAQAHLRHLLLHRQPRRERSCSSPGRKRVPVPKSRSDYSGTAGNSGWRPGRRDATSSLPAAILARNPRSGAGQTALGPHSVIEPAGRSRAACARNLQTGGRRSAFGCCGIAVASAPPLLRSLIFRAGILPPDLLLVFVGLG
jgi:hypothetical protein